MSDADAPTKPMTPDPHTRSGLDGRVAVISGATGGLGRVAARALFDAGARLTLLGTNAERLQALADELAEPSDRLLIHAVDLTKPDGAPDAAAAVAERFGRVDIVLHLVGGWAGGQSVPDVTDEVVADMLGRHLWSTLYLARAFVPHLTANGWGRFIAVSSPAASEPPPRQLPYVVGKAAEEALVLTLARELRGSGVTANLIVVQKIEAAERGAESSGRPGTTADEIVAAIHYLCSDDAGAVNGARIPLYGSR